MNKKIFNTLGLTNKNGLYVINKDNWKGVLPQRTENILETIIKPDAFFLFNNEPFILFFDNPNNKNEVLKNCWNLNQSPIIFISNDKDIEIYNGLSFIKEQNTAEPLSNENWQEDFSFFNIISGKTLEKFHSELSSKNRVDTKLLENIKAIRTLLTDKYQLLPQTTNSLIGRLIFIRYLIDRKVVIGFNENNNGRLTNDSLCEILNSKQETYQLFDYIKSKFNGNLFPVTGNEITQIKEKHLSEFIKLLQGVEISTEQMSLFDIYDFSIIPIELISNVYEFFIGQTEQENKGAYYTPLFLVNQVLNETVHEYFKLKPTEYNCKIIDPACGSGVFLVEALRKIISQYQNNTPNYDTDIEKYQTIIKKLLTDNIFGIDKDENAVNVAIFSLYITLLDYLTPPEIVEFKFPPLLNKNFFVDDFFNLKAEYNTILNTKNNKFNFIIGNPPWEKIEESVHLYDAYWKEREKTETEIQKKQNFEFKGKVQIKVSRKEIAQAFLIRVSDFSFEECAFVITSKVLYNLNAKTFRTYFLENFAIRKVFEMSSLRHEIFDKSNDAASCPATVLYYSYSPEKEKNRQNLVTHISLKPNRFFEVFKMFTVEKHDQKQLFQSYFMDYDWIWKVLVYGNILDFYLLKRLKEYTSISSIISNENDFLIGQGIMVGGGDKNPVPKLLNKPFIDTKKKDLKQFHIQLRENSIWQHEHVHRARNLELFSKNSLLIKEGTSKEFNSVSAISYTNVVFTSSITAVKAIRDKNIPILKAICGLFNSNLFAFYMVSVGSSVGIEREQTHDEEKFDFPYNSSTKLIEFVTQIEQTAKQKHETEMKLSEEYQEAEINYNKLLAEIDKEILKIYQITEQEKALIDYTHEISIPLIKRRDKQRIFGTLNLQNRKHKEYLTDYVKIFTDHYN
ncbi:MAG: N-6 DNA methylase, partial [Bacteroidota bacterium]|nr:N-6 DNA methylase [Bacteroidota bacterium]